jgi:hypothetical protein
MIMLSGTYYSQTSVPPDMDDLGQVTDGSTKDNNYVVAYTGPGD